MNGVVIEFDKKHKFGFVIDKNNGRYFLHKKTVEASGIEDLDIGDKLEFLVDYSRRKQAVDIRKVK